MGLMPIAGFGITLAGMKSLQAKWTPIQWKPITLSCVIIWPVSLANHVAFLAARMRSNALYVYSFMLQQAEIL